VVALISSSASSVACVKDRLDSLGTRLSGGQQQRLTIARALSHEPEVLCLDEFSIAIDPVTTMRIEDVLRDLQSKMTIILVTNLVQQARRLADRTAFLLNGELVEVDATEVIFSDSPSSRKTHGYVNGIFG
jgi:phosphate transport system ATP-binding protein